MRPGTNYESRGTGEGSLGLLPPGSDPVRNLTAPRAAKLYPALLGPGLVDAALDRSQLDRGDLRGWSAGIRRRVAPEIDHAVLDDGRRLLAALRKDGLRGGGCLVEGERKADPRRGLAVELRVARLDEEVLVLVQAV